MFVGPAVLSSLGIVVIILCQYVPQIGLAWRPFYSKDIPGGEFGQCSEWASFAVTHVGFSLVVAALLWACLLSDQNGRDYFKDESAWVGISLAALLVTFGHMGLGIMIGTDWLKEAAAMPRFENLVEDPLTNPTKPDVGLYHMLRSRVFLFMGLMVMPGYVIMGVFNALIHTHTDANIAVVVFFVILLPVGELGVVMYRTKLFKQFERTDSSCWGSEGIISTGLNVVCWVMVCWSISSSR